MHTYGLTLYSSMMAVSTFKQVSTPSSSRGRWRGKSIRENLVWSGRANRRGAWRSFGRTCTCKQKMSKCAIFNLYISFSCFIKFEIFLCKYVWTFYLPVNSIQLLTVFQDNSSFVWPEAGSVARSRRLRATDPFEVQTKMLLSEKPVYNCFVIHLLFSKFSSLFPLTYPLDVFNILVRQVRESGRRFDIVTSISRDLFNQWK